MLRLSLSPGGETCPLELDREIPRALREGREDPLRFRFVLRSARPFEILRQRERGLEVCGVELDGAPPVRDGSIEMAVPAFVQATQSFDGGVARGERGGLVEALCRLVELLLP